MNRTSQVGISLGGAVSKVASAMREIKVKVSGAYVGESPWLFADIRLSPGNSGGPLADTGGSVVGINSMIVGPLGCAITSDAVEKFLRKFNLSEAA